MSQLIQFKQGQTIRLRVNVNPKLKTDIPALNTATLLQIHVERGDGSEVQYGATIAGTWILEAIIPRTDTVDTARLGDWGLSPYAEYPGNITLVGDSVSFRVEKKILKNAR